MAMFKTMRKLADTCYRYAIPIILFLTYAILEYHHEWGIRRDYYNWLMILCVTSIPFITTISASSRKIAWSVALFACIVCIAINQYILFQEHNTTANFLTFFAASLLAVLFLPYSDQSDVNKQVNYTLKAFLGIFVFIAGATSLMIIYSFFDGIINRLIPFIIPGICFLSIIPHPNDPKLSDNHHGIFYRIFVNGLLVPLTIIAFTASYAICLIYIIGIDHIDIKQPYIIYALTVLLASAFLTHFFGRPLAEQAANKSAIYVIVRLIPWFTWPVLLLSIIPIVIHYKDNAINHLAVEIGILIFIGILFSVWSILDRKRTLYVAIIIPLLATTEYIDNKGTTYLQKEQLNGIFEKFPPETLPFTTKRQLVTWLNLLPDDEQKIMSYYVAHQLNEYIDIEEISKTDLYSISELLENNQLNSEETDGLYKIEEESTSKEQQYEDDSNEEYFEEEEYTEEEIYDIEEEEVEAENADDKDVEQPEM